MALKKLLQKCKSKKYQKAMEDIIEWYFQYWCPEKEIDPKYFEESYMLEETYRESLERDCTLLSNDSSSP